MFPTPIQVYKKLLQTVKVSETVLCNLHKPCKDNRQCRSVSSYKVLDFDAVEKEMSAREKRAPHPSVDAVACTKSSKTFCFIEMKGWKEFVKHNGIKDEIAPSEADVNNVVGKASAYDLQGKFDNSCDLCKTIMSDKSLFEHIKIAYIVVSDVDSRHDAMDDFASNLTSLAMTSSIWTVCDRELEKNLKNVFSVVDKHYTHCQEFDELMEKID